MAARAGITIDDGQPTPVAHAFTPDSVVDDKGLQIATWKDKASGILLAQPVLTLSTRRANKTSKVTKVTARLVLPVLETLNTSAASGVNPAPTLAYSLTMNCEMLFPDRSTLQERKDLVTLMRGFLAHTTMNKATQEYEMPW